jgi:hypothetical protein
MNLGDRARREAEAQQQAEEAARKAHLVEQESRCVDGLRESIERWATSLGASVSLIGKVSYRPEHYAETSYRDDGVPRHSKVEAEARAIFRADDIEFDAFYNLAGRFQVHLKTPAAFPSSSDFTYHLNPADTVAKPINTLADLGEALKALDEGMNYKAQAGSAVSPGPAESDDPQAKRGRRWRARRRPG